MQAFELDDDKHDDNKYRKVIAKRLGWIAAIIILFICILFFIPRKTESLLLSISSAPLPK